MKIQDIGFIIVFILLLVKHNPRWVVIAGIVSLVLAVPFFSFWVFFTAERLTWYATGFFLLAIIFYFSRSKKHRNEL